jgi:hypothetical protein
LRSIFPAIAMRREEIGGGGFGGRTLRRTNGCS